MNTDLFFKDYFNGAPMWRWNRSPYPGYAYSVRFLNRDGSVNYDAADNSDGVLPACNII